MVATPDGGFLVLWLVELERPQSQFSGRVAVQAKRFSATGTTLWEARVSDANNQVIERPMVQATAEGFVFAWTSKPVFTMPGRGYLQRLASDGSLLGTSVEVASGYGQQQVSAVPLRDGSILAVWLDGVNPSERSPYSRRFDASLGAMTPPAPVLDASTSNVLAVSAAALSNGNVGLGWIVGSSAGVGVEVRSAVLSQLGTPVSAIQGTSTGLPEAGSATRFTSPSITVVSLGAGGFGVAWQIEERNDREAAATIWLRRFALSGMPADNAPLEVESRQTAAADSGLQAGSGFGLAGGPDAHFVAAFHRAEAAPHTYLMGQ